MNCSGALASAQACIAPKLSWWNHPPQIMPSLPFICAKGKLVGDPHRSSCVTKNSGCMYHIQRLSRCCETIASRAACRRCGTSTMHSSGDTIWHRSRSCWSRWYRFRRSQAAENRSKTLSGDAEQAQGQLDNRQGGAGAMRSGSRHHAALGAVSARQGPDRDAAGLILGQHSYPRLGLILRSALLRVSRRMGDMSQSFTPYGSRRRNGASSP